MLWHSVVEPGAGNLVTEPRVFWLSMHVPYACRHSGACCSSGWSIPLEPERVAAVRNLRRDESWLLPAPGAPSDVAGVIATSASGRCVFHRDGCEIHRAFGPAAMPSACQHFPREVLIDSRGVFVTLSHYCPTAADLLFDHVGKVEIVTGPPPVPHRDPEGLDARHVLPPLLTEGVLMDHAGYDAWEGHMIRVLTGDDGRSPEHALAILAGDLAALSRWRPGRTSLLEEIAHLSPSLPFSTSVPAWTSVPEPTSVAGSTSVPAAVVIRRFLAARAFASWMAYQGNGLRAVVGRLFLTLDTLRQRLAQSEAGDDLEPSRERLKEAIRQTDLLLVHEMPRDELARRATEQFRRA
jgi:hypothetical protein